MLVTIGYTGLRWGEAIGLELDYVRPGELHVEWQLREVGGRFHRLPPKDDSYRSPNWEPCLPVDLPRFLASLITGQVRAHAGRRCACAAQHGGTGRYVFLSPDGGHPRRSNYARRVFRPACDGRYEGSPGREGRLVIADATVWPGIPVAAWPAAQRGDGPGTGPGAQSGMSTDMGTGEGFTPPRGRGIPVIAEDVPLTCWLPVKPGLTPHGLRHSHKTWMAEDGIPEILAEQRLGHEVPGMRGLYAHASDRMRDDLKDALQARWEDSLRARAAIHPHAPMPLLDGLLAPYRRQQPGSSRPDDTTWDREGAAATRRRGEEPGEVDLPNSSQISPRPHPGTRMGSVRRASDLARCHDHLVGDTGIEPVTSSV